jgi:hypothetical protein
MASQCFESALHIALQLRRRELSAVECLEYFRARVERLRSMPSSFSIGNGHAKLRASPIARWHRGNLSDRCTACR